MYGFAGLGEMIPCQPILLARQRRWRVIYIELTDLSSISGDQDMCSNNEYVPVGTSCILETDRTSGAIDCQNRASADP